MIGIVFHPIAAYLLVSQSQMNLGVIGIAIAYNITSLIVFGAMIYMTNLEPKLSEGVFWPDRRSF